MRPALCAHGLLFTYIEYCTSTIQPKTNNRKQRQRPPIHHFFHYDLFFSTMGDFMLRIQANLNNFTHPLTCPINLHATFNFQQNDSLGRCPRQFLPRRWWRRRRAARSLRQKENVENDFGGAGGRPGGTPDNENDNAGSSAGRAGRYRWPRRPGGSRR